MTHKPPVCVKTTKSLTRMQSQIAQTDLGFPANLVTEHTWKHHCRALGLLTPELVCQREMQLETVIQQQTAGG